MGAVVGVHIAYRAFGGSGKKEKRCLFLSADVASSIPGSRAW